MNMETMIATAPLPAGPEGRNGWPWTVNPGEVPSYDPAVAWPRISIVTPSFNQGQFLEETIRSVLLQGYPNLEYFVMDGGSTDDSVDVIKKYEPWLTGWVSRKDRGQSHAINEGFSRATGAIYAYINSDDLLAPGALEAVAKQFLAGAQWVVGDVRCFEQGSEDWPYPAVEETHRDEMLWKIHFTQQGSFWSGEAFRRLGPFREELRYVFDYEYWMRLRFVGQMKPTVLKKLLASYRFHATSKGVAEGNRFRLESQPVQSEYTAKLPIARRMRASVRSRYPWADIAQLDALRSLSRGDRRTATRWLMRSIVLWPLLLFSRRTLGLIRRIMAGHN